MVIKPEMHRSTLKSPQCIFLCLSDSVHLSDAGSAGGVSVELRDKDHQVLQQGPRLHLPPLETQGTAGTNDTPQLEQNSEPQGSGIRDVFFFFLCTQRYFRNVCGTDWP